MASQDKTSTSLECLYNFNITVNCLGNITSHSKEQGYKYFIEGYVHSVKLGETVRSICSNVTETLQTETKVKLKDLKEIECRAKCYRSMRKSLPPDTVNINLALDDRDKVTVPTSHCRCVAGVLYSVFVI